MATKRKAKPTVGITTRSKEIIIQCQMNVTADDLVVKLEAEGYKPSRGSAGTLLADFKQSVRVLDAAGKIKSLTVAEKK